MTRRGLLLLLCLLAAVSACAARPEAPPYAVSSDLLRDETTRQVRVWAPDADGSWPVVYAMPGTSGHKSDFDLLGPALARRGVVVFATDYRTDTLVHLVDDLACGYRLARQKAGEYGGDLTRPVTGLGYSFGAPYMVAGSLSPGGGEGTADNCSQGQPRPDVVVGVNGCYYTRQPLPMPVAELTRREAKVVLVASSDDTTCPVRDTSRAYAALEAAGFHPTLTTIRGSDHYAPVFHDVVRGEWVRRPGNPAGRQTVRVILDAIEGGS